MRNFDDQRDLANLPLFAGIAEDELRRISLRLGRTSLPAGAVLMSADQPGETAYVILTGTLRVLLADAEGVEITLALLGPGEIVGEMALIDDDVRSATVMAIEPVALLAIDRATFQYCRIHVPRLPDNLIRILARRLRHTNAQLFAVATLGVPDRVARQLLLLAETYGRPVPAGALIDLRVTQDDLAHFVAASRVRVNQAIGEFRRLGLVSIAANHRFVIHGTWV
jgi:CRP/FNR family transcriptional regulator, cyclic AMP receptor protein